jgi:CxxC-x17-CxxC domain-containing protein
LQIWLKEVSERFFFCSREGEFRGLGTRAERGNTPMEFQDKTLKCVDCGEDFIFTAGEQLFFHDKQFKNEPKRCKACKGKRAQALGLPAAGYSKVETRAICSGCEKETTVPFKPTQGRPVFCRECFQSKKTSAATAS